MFPHDLRKRAFDEFSLLSRDRIKTGLTPDCVRDTNVPRRNSLRAVSFFVRIITEARVCPDVNHREVSTMNNARRSTAQLRHRAFSSDEIPEIPESLI